MKETMEKDLSDLTGLTGPFEVEDQKFEESVAAVIEKFNSKLEVKAAGLMSHAPASSHITGSDVAARRGEILRQAAEFTEQDKSDLKKHGYVPKKIRARPQIEAEAPSQYRMWSCRSLHEQIEKLTTEQIAGELQAGQQVAGELQSQADLIEKLTTELTTEQIAGELQSQAELLEKLTTEPTPEQIAGELQAWQQTAGELQAGEQVGDR